MSETKSLSTLKARLALLGHEVYELADGGFVVTRVGDARRCPDLAALGAFLRLIGGAV